MILKPKVSFEVFFFFLIPRTFFFGSLLLALAGYPSCHGCSYFSVPEDANILFSIASVLEFLLSHVWKFSQMVDDPWLSDPNEALGSRTLGARAVMSFHLQGAGEQGQALGSWVAERVPDAFSVS